MISVVLSIGSNCGDRPSLVKETIEWLKTVLIQMDYSDIYETPCALKAGKPYMNAVVKGFFQGDGMDLESMLKDKEREMGRDQKCREKGDVPVDIDIVIENGGIIKPWDFRQKFFQTGYSQLIP